MNPSAEVKLAGSGLRATIVPDRFQKDAFILEIDGTPQSHVYELDNGELFFEYVRRIGHVIDLVRERGEPITVLHLGAGALTLPRYVEAHRPGSVQHVIELEPNLIPFVTEQLPLPPSMHLHVHIGDAREQLSKLPRELTGTVDLMIVDVFSGSRTPAHVTSLEFYQEAAKLIAPAGVIVVNVADGPGLAFARGQAATLTSAFAEVVAMADTQVLKGHRFGNVVFAASAQLDFAPLLPRLLASGPHPASALAGETLAKFIGNATMVIDDTAIASPNPKKSFLQL